MTTIAHGGSKTIPRDTSLHISTILCLLASILVHSLFGSIIDIYDSTSGVKDYRLMPGDTLVVHGDALKDDVRVWLNGGELRIVNDVTIAAAITQDVSSVIFLEGTRNVKFTGALSVAGTTVNNLVITGDVSSASSEIAFSGTWDTATTRDAIYIKTGTTIFTNGTFMVGGYLYWEAQARDAIVENDATLYIFDREGEKPNNAYVPYFRPFSNGNVFEVRTGGSIQFGPYRQFLVGCGTKEHIGGAANNAGWTATFRVSGGAVEWTGQGTSSQNSIGRSTDGVILYGKRSNSPTENHASVFEFCGGTFAAGANINRYGAWKSSSPTYITVKWSGGIWNVVPNYYGSQNFILTKTRDGETRINMPCEITGDVTLDLTKVKNGNGVNQMVGDSLKDSSILATSGNGRWMGRDTASLIVNGGNGNGSIKMYSFHPNGMALSLSNKAHFIVHEFDRGEQKYRSMSIASGCYFETMTNVILTVAGTSVPPVDRLITPQVDVAQDAEGTLGTVRLSFTYGQTTYANANFAPVKNGELYLSDVPDGVDVRGYEIPALFDSVTDADNLRSWSVFVNGSRVKNLAPIRDGTGRMRIVSKGLKVVLR